jgi:transmembrane protein EpsG
LILSALVFLTFAKRGQGVEKSIAVLLVLTISLVSGIRWETGTDWLPYYDFFVMCGDFDDCMQHPHFEYGYKFIVWLFRQGSDSYSVWLFIFTLFVMGVKLIAVADRPYILIVFLVIFGVSLGDLFPVRQSLAISIGILALYFYSNNRLTWFLGLVIMAGMVHKTAFILGFIPFILILNVGWVYFSAVFSGIFVYFAFFIISDYLANLVGADYVSYQVGVYTADFIGRVSFGSLAYKAVILSVLAFLSPMYKGELNKFELNSIKLTIFGLIFSSIIELGNGALNRISIYFVSFEVVAVPVLIYFFIRELVLRRSYHAVFVVILTLNVFYMGRFLVGLEAYSDLYLPYETIFHSFHKIVY